MKKRWAVYDIFADDLLIYVGITCRPSVRLSQHKSHGVIPYFATMRVVEWFDTRKAAMEAERKRIKELKPPRNVNLAPRREKRPWLMRV